MDFSDNMKLIATTAFPNARISLDRFHVFQDLNRYEKIMVNYGNLFPYYF